MQIAFNPDVEAAINSIAGRAVTSVYLVACGGSLSIMMPGKYFLDRHSRNVACDALNADEFVCRNPARLSRNSLVILCSQTGTTRETVRAAKHAREHGALTIGMTLDLSSPLAKAVDHAVAYQASYTTGIPIDAADSNYAVLYRLLVGVLYRADGEDFSAPLAHTLANLQRVIDASHAAFASRFAEIAERYAKAAAIYTLAAGPAYGAAYSFSTCVLMEMQWYDSQAIHANEFFHGPFEIVDDKACFIVMLGIDETRPLVERAHDFLLKHGNAANILSLDASELDLSSLDQRFAGYLVPLILFDTLWKFAYRLADLRKQPMLSGRRFMKKISDY